MGDWKENEVAKGICVFLSARDFVVDGDRH